MELTPAEVTPNLAPGAPPGGTRRTKLGLSLAGGGFRATIFHVGVLWRLAELDLLRHVEVLSTVSGGSITGAHYALLLKKAIDAKASLQRADYLRLVETLLKDLKAAIQKNLRIRLFWNPLELLRIMVTPYGLGQRMARLYDRHLYRRVFRSSGGGRSGDGPRLRDLKCRPGGVPIGDLEKYNSEPANTSKVPSLILNATSLNSGAPFRFTSTEIGDPELGFMRYDEIETELLSRKDVLGMQQSALRRALSAAGMSPQSITIKGKSHNPLLVRYVALWKEFNDVPAGGTWVQFLPQPLQGHHSLILALAQAPLGVLRLAKIEAWYFVRGPAQTPPVAGGLSVGERRERFWIALKVIDESLALAAQAALGQSDSELAESVLQLYYVRMAGHVARPAAKAFGDIRVADAVAASASFPPVFTPYRVSRLYDERIVALLGLTDGGVYDNMGITNLLNEGCTHIVASDTGGVFDRQPHVSSGRLGMMGRMSSILMNDVAEQQRSALRERRRVTDGIENASGPKLQGLKDRYQLRGLAYFHIASDPIVPTLPAFDRQGLSRLRTDLDAFGDVEIEALVNHGYATADDYIRKYIEPKDFNVGPWTAPGSYPLKLMPRNDAERKRLERILKVGRQRLGRGLALRAPVACIAIGVLVLAIIADFAAGLPVTRGLAQAIAATTLFFVQFAIIFVRSWWSSSSTTAWERLAVAGGLLALVPLGIVARWAHVRFETVRWLVARVRTLSGNGLWLLGLAPLWLAAGVAVTSWFGYWTQGRPFLAKTRKL